MQTPGELALAALRHPDFDLVCVSQQIDHLGLLQLQSNILHHPALLQQLWV